MRIKIQPFHEIIDCCQCLKTQVRVLHHIIFKFIIIDYFVFLGKQLYLFDSQYLLPGYPKNLVQLGLPEHLEKLDAAMVWGYNGKTYFYSGTMYWK